MSKYRTEKLNRKDNRRFLQAMMTDASLIFAGKSDKVTWKMRTWREKWQWCRASSLINENTQTSGVRDGTSLARGVARCTWSPTRLIFFVFLWRRSIQDLSVLRYPTGREIYGRRTVVIPEFSILAWQVLSNFESVQNVTDITDGSVSIAISCCLANAIIFCLSHCLQNNSHTCTAVYPLGRT